MTGIAEPTRRTPLNPVWITGTSAIVGPLNNLDSVWTYLLRDEPVPSGALAPSEVQCLARLEASDRRIVGRTQALAIAVTEMAWTAAGLPAARQSLRGETGATARQPSWGIVGGSSVGGLAEMEVEWAATAAKIRESKSGESWSPYAVTRWRGNACTAAVSRRFGLGGPDFSLNAASATGAQTALLASHLVACGIADLVVAVAADMELPPKIFAAMESNGSIAPETAGGPLTPTRRGMRPTEGAGCMIFESESHARSRGRSPKGIWLGGQSANESYHFLAPAPDGDATRECIAAVLHRCGLAPANVDWALLHATGTRRFDAVEVQTLSKTFGEQWPWITAVKRSTGHVLGASGLIEAAVAIEGIDREELPAWPKEVDPALQIPAAPDAPRKPRVALQLSQGMGGTVIVNLWGTAKTSPEHEEHDLTPPA